MNGRDSGLSNSLGHRIHWFSLAVGIYDHSCGAISGHSRLRAFILFIQEEIEM